MIRLLTHKSVTPQSCSPDMDFPGHRMVRLVLVIAVLVLVTLPSALPFRLGRLPSQKARWTMQQQARSPDGTDSDGICRRKLLTGAGSVFVLFTAEDAQARLGTLPEYGDSAIVMRRVTLKTADLEKAINFYEQLGMEVVKKASVRDGYNETTLAFGRTPLSIPKDFISGVSSFSLYGGHMSLCLREKVVQPGEPTPFYDPGSSVDFLQFGVPSLRLSKLVAAGGTILSAYGYAEVLSPDGLRHRVVVGRRRDPFMMVALKASDVKKEAQKLAALGFREEKYPIARPTENSPFEPPEPKKSVYMGFDGESPGILLVPATRGPELIAGSLVEAIDFAIDPTMMDPSDLTLSGVALQLRDEPSK